MLRTLCDSGQVGPAHLLVASHSERSHAGDSHRLGLGLETRCGGHGTKFSFEYAGFYWAFHVLVAYIVAWLMNDDGFIGGLIHNPVKQITPA